MAAENRTSRGHSINHGARIVAADRKEVRSRVIDISGTSARLEVSQPEALPDEFILLLSHDGKLKRSCSVVWRRNKAVGVRFIVDRSSNSG